MKKTLLLSCLFICFLTYSQNLVSNGNLEQWAFPSSPNDWSSSSDFGIISQNTIDFSEGASSAQLTSQFGDPISMFTTVDIPLVGGTNYTLKFSYKYLGSDFNTDDNIEFSIFSIGNIATVNIQDNNWNTVEVDFTPTITSLSYELMVSVIGDNFSFNDYEVLIDNIIIEEQSTLSTADFSLENEIKLISIENKQLSIKKPNNLKINTISVFSVLGIKQNIKISQDFSKLNLQSLSSGIYLINISTDKGIITKKTIVK